MTSPNLIHLSDQAKATSRECAGWLSARTDSSSLVNRIVTNSMSSEEAYRVATIVAAAIGDYHYHKAREGGGQ